MRSLRRWLSWCATQAAIAASSSVVASEPFSQGSWMLTSLACRSRSSRISFSSSSHR
jgi:hypothetical protein